MGQSLLAPLKGGWLRCASDIGFLSPFFMEEGEERRREKEENPTPPGGQNNKPDICHISDTAKRMLARKGRTKGGRGGGVHYSVLQAGGRNWGNLTFMFMFRI